VLLQLPPRPIRRHPRPGRPKGRGCSGPSVCDGMRLLQQCRPRPGLRRARPNFSGPVACARPLVVACSAGTPMLCTAAPGDDGDTRFGHLHHSCCGQVCCRPPRDWLRCWRKFGRRCLRTPLPPWRHPFAPLCLSVPDVAGENLTHLGLVSAVLSAT
jgi:hypothetical protein